MSGLSHRKLPSQSCNETRRLRLIAAAVVKSGTVEPVTSSKTGGLIEKEPRQFWEYAFQIVRASCRVVRCACAVRTGCQVRGLP